MLEKIKQALEKANLKDWLDDTDIFHVYDEVLKLQPDQSYVEIGVAFGASSAIACLAAQPGVRIYAIDTLDQPGREDNIRTFLAEFDMKLEDCNYNFIHGDSQFIARFWKNGYISALFIDGDHTYEGVVRDIISWFPWIFPISTVIFDDYVDGGGVKRAINELLIDHQAFTKTYADGPTFIVKK